MIYGKRYIQFNDLVFDGFDLVSSSTNDVSFKTNSQDYTFKHGSYMPFKANYTLVETQSISMTLTFPLKKLNCEQRPFFRNFVISQLTKPGRLWALLNGSLVWAWAVVTSIGDNSIEEHDKLALDVDFELWEGIWHKANLQKTFLPPYDICTFMDCLNYQDPQPCKTIIEQGCCFDCVKVTSAECNCCGCDELTKDMALCYIKGNLEEYFTNCSFELQIKYNCDKAEEFFCEDSFGQKFCGEDACANIIAGNFYSTTDIPTTATVIIDGMMHNPAIKINGNENTIVGDYDGILIVKANGDIYFQADPCCKPELLDAGNWEVMSGNTYGWTVNAGNNSIVVDTHLCCGVTCVYVQDDPITI